MASPFIIAAAIGKLVGSPFLEDTIIVIGIIPVVNLRPRSYFVVLHSIVAG